MKKTILNLFVLLALFAIVFSSCKDDDDDAKTPATTLSVDAFKGETQYKSSDKIEISSSGGTATATPLSFVLSNKAKDTKWTIAPALPTAGITVVDAEGTGTYSLVIANYTLAKDTEYTVTGKSGDKSATRKFTLKAATVTAKSKSAVLTGVLYALQQYKQPDLGTGQITGQIVLEFVDPKGIKPAAAKIYFTISAGAKITKPATGVTKTSVDHVNAANDFIKTNDFLETSNILGAPKKLATANVWEMALPTAAGDVDVEVTAEDGTTMKEYKIKINEAPGKPVAKKTVTLKATLPNTPTGKFYVAWSVVTTGATKKQNIGALTFTGDDEKVERTATLDVDADKVAGKFVVTIEASATIANPAGPAILKGDFANGATITLGGVAAVTGAPAGSYILATPSDNTAGVDDANPTHGIWFLKEGTDTAKTKTASLTLPDLTGTDFVYEGWVVDGTTPISTGKFTKPAGADTGKLYYDGTSPGFPGEDFLKNPADGATGHLDALPVPLNGKKVVISLELKDDTDLVPYFIKPLSGVVPASPAVAGDLTATVSFTGTLTVGGSLSGGN